MNTADKKTSSTTGHNLSRRDFIQKATAAGVAASLPATALPGKAQAQTMKQGGRLRQALSGGSTTDTLFGVLGEGDIHQVNVQWQLLSNLTAIGADGQVKPELAEAGSRTRKAPKWVFNLRQGVEFHNGKTLTSADVVHSLAQHMGEDSRSTGKGLFAAVTDVQADGKNKVIVTLNSPDADFPYTMSDYHFPIAPDGSMDEEWEKGHRHRSLLAGRMAARRSSADQAQPKLF